MTRPVKRQRAGENSKLVLLLLLIIVVVVLVLVVGVLLLRLLLGRLLGLVGLVLGLFLSLHHAGVGGLRERLGLRLVVRDHNRVEDRARLHLPHLEREDAKVRVLGDGRVVLVLGVVDLGVHPLALVVGVLNALHAPLTLVLGVGHVGRLPLAVVRLVPVVGHRRLRVGDLLRDLIPPVRLLVLRVAH